MVSQLDIVIVAPPWSIILVTGSGGIAAPCHSEARSAEESLRRDSSLAKNARSE